MLDSAARQPNVTPFLLALLPLSGCGSPAHEIAKSEPAPAIARTVEPAATEPAKPVPLPELAGNELVLAGPVRFETGSDTLRAESDAILEPVKRYLDEKTYITLMRIEAHTDNDGDAQANQALSEQRALSVARWLVTRGIDCRRLLPVGFGATKPIAPNDMPQNKAQNRRMAFVNAALRNKPIGGMPVDGGGRIAGDPCQ